MAQGGLSDKNTITSIFGFFLCLRPLFTSYIFAILKALQQLTPLVTFYPLKIPWRDECPEDTTTPSHTVLLYTKSGFLLIKGFKARFNISGTAFDLIRPLGVGKVSQEARSFSSDANFASFGTRSG